MPEGPEVYTYSAQLASLLGAGFSTDVMVRFQAESTVKWKSQTLLSVEHIGPSVVCKEDLSACCGYPVSVVRHFGKTTTLTTAGGRLIVISYGMTGSWSLVQGPYSRLKFDFGFDQHLFFNDVRKFGRVSHANAQERLDNIGPSIFVHDYLTRLIPDYVRRYGNRGLRWFLLDSYIAPGIGNYLVNEALWHANLHPEKKAKDLTQDEWTLLVKVLKSLFTNSIMEGGMSMSDYVHLDGSKGNFYSKLRCYRQTQCDRCRGPIERLKDGESSHYFCPVCQPVSISVAS